MFTFDPKSIFAPDLHSENKPTLFGEHRPSPTMPERIEDTARMLRDTLERLRMFEKGIEDKVSDLMRTITQDNVLFKDLMETGWSNFVSEVKTEINLFEASIQSTLSLFEENTNAQLTEQLDKIIQAETYMRTHLNESLDTLLHEMKNNGTLTGIIESDVMLVPSYFGAVGDGITDDTAAMQTVINKAAETGIPVNINRMYKISGVIVDANNVTIKGDGCIIGDIIIGGSNITRECITLKDFNIEGRVVLRRIRHCVLDSLNFTGNAEFCIERDPAITVPKHQIGYNQIRNCTMHTGGGFLCLPWVTTDDEFPYSDIEIVGCTANPVRTNFIYAEHLDGAKIAENYIQYYDYTNTFTKYTGIEVHYSDWVNIQNNTIFETGSHGIMMDNSRHFNIVGNTLGWNGENFIAHGIYICGGWNGGKLQKGIIANNVISQTSGNSIHIDGGGFIEINGNVCRFTYQPVYMGKSSANVNESLIAAHPHYAVGYDDVANDLIISNNVSYGANYKVNNPNINHNILNNYSDAVGIISVERIKVDMSTDAVLDTLGISVISLKPSGVRHITSLNGEQYGRKVTIYSANNEGTVIKSGAGNITLNENKDFAMKANSTLTLWYVGNGWVELSRSY